MSDENNKSADFPNKETSKILYSDFPKHGDSLSGKLEMGGLPLVGLPNGIIHRTPAQNNSRNDLKSSYNCHVKQKEKKGEQIGYQSAELKENHFRKRHTRIKPPSCLRQPTKEWLDHLELVRQVSAKCPKNNHILKSSKHLRNNQFLFELPIDTSKITVFLPLIGAM